MSYQPQIALVWLLLVVQSSDIPRKFLLIRNMTTASGLGRSSSSVRWSCTSGVFSRVYWRCRLIFSFNQARLTLPRLAIMMTENINRIKTLSEPLSSRHCISYTSGRYKTNDWCWIIYSNGTIESVEAMPYNIDYIFPSLPIAAS